MPNIDILRQDSSILICIKPAGILSTDEPGGLPSLVRETLGDPGATVRTVHRLDRVVSGLMVLARSRSAASKLGQQVMAGHFDKEYLAVIHGVPESPSGTLTDLLLRDKAERKTYAVSQPQKGAQEAVLDYAVLQSASGMSLIRIRLRTGRTHQIRVQFSARGLPLVGDKKYSILPDDCKIALWSHRLTFAHPKTGETVDVTAPPPEVYPWTEFHIDAERAP